MVKDVKDDANSFLVNDYLIADPDTMEALPAECGPLYKIVAIETLETGVDYDTLKLSVQLPESMMEYIYAIDARGTGPDLTINHEGNATRRRMGDWWTFDINADESKKILDLEFGPWDQSFSTEAGVGAWKYPGYQQSYVCSLYRLCRCH